MRKKGAKALLEVLCVVLVLLLFGTPLYYVLVNSFKSRVEAAKMSISLPTQLQIIENYTAVLQEQNGIVLRAFWNSTLITVLSIVLLVFVCSMAGFVLGRRKGKGMNIISFIILSGLMIPPAIVPTIWVLNGLNLFKTIPGLVLVQVALAFPFSTILYRGFIATIPREIDESALLDGCSPFRLYRQMIFPLLKPVTSTVIVLSAVNIFNDFTNPLYFLPGAKNATVQLTLYNFMTQFSTRWNLLFADVVLITIPPLLLFIFFNEKIVAGMTAGAVKG